VAGVGLATVLDSSVRRRPVGEGLSFPALDLFVHAWDLARSVGEDVEIEAGVIEFAHRVIDPPFLLPWTAGLRLAIFLSHELAAPRSPPSQRARSVSRP
jgi:hypothetical protein